ncbi:MAG TPA: TonB-dependent receptor [Vicinamibacteria bacterium]|nr:TonB-dependent receptor [Vicinamibacteria bacterium]
MRRLTHERRGSCGRTLWALALAAAAVLASPSGASAQATGAITGVVTDDSGALLPGATVQATSQATGQVRTAASGADGFYTLPLLPPGLYNVAASLSGFAPHTREGVRVSVAETARVDVSLKVGPLAETVVVQADAPLIETTNATLGIVIDEKKVVDLPLNGRNFAQLGTLIPGVVAPPVSLGGQSGDASPGGFGNVTGGFNVNGMRNQSNNFLIDGATNNDTFNTGFVLRPPPDAIQEFKILTHSYNAEYGRNAGSVVTLVTKSGSNEWHGALWEFNRDDARQARNYFAPATQPKPVLKQNQFGAALGAPLAKNRLFAFGYYEGYRNQSGLTQTLLVPTAAQRRGDFSGSPAVRDPLTGQPFPGNVIPAGRLDPIAQRLLADFVPPANVGANRYTASPTVGDDRDQAGLRLDYRATEEHSILARYLWSHTNRVTPRTVQAADQLAKATLQDFMIGDTYMFSSRAINVARFSFNRIYANPQVTSGRQNSEYGIDLPNTNPLAVGLPSIVVAGFFAGATALGDLQQPFVERVNNVFQFTDDLTYLTGRHSFKLGVDVRRENMKIAFINRPNGDVTFSGGITGNAMADFLLGLPAQARATTTQAIQDGHGWLYAAYVQDEFRVTPRLTLNLGVRYELPIPFVDKNDAITAVHVGVQSQKFKDAPRGLVYPGDPGVPRGVVPTDKNNVAPRLAAVWDPTGRGRTSIRAAWGLFYDALAGQGDFFQSGVLSPPFTPLVELNTPTPITLADPLGALAGGPRLFPANLTIIGWGNDFQSPYAHHYNLTVQQQIGRSLGVELGYVGSRGKHLPIFMEVNPGVYTPGQTTRSTQRVMPAFALLRPTFSVAESWYDALQASARLRPTRGLNFLASYTWSHAIDHVSGLNIGGENRPVLPVVQGDEASVEAALAYEKGNALFDVRHRFVVSFGYELPRLEDRGALVRHALGGWQLNGIFQAQTGFPLSVNEGGNLSIRFLTARPDVVCDPNGGPKTTAEWFDTSCFVRRTLAQSGERPGDAGRNTVRGPGFNRTDLSLFKNIAVRRSHALQLRVEAFNLFNQVRFGQPAGTIGAATFGQILGADDGRIVQLGVKYIF